MKERFAVPCVGAIIERREGENTFLLLQTRQKDGGGETNGLLELPAGKVREYEDLFSALRREVREETGLRLTVIHGEETACREQAAGGALLSCAPFCVTQNLSGAYSILLHTFLCEAEGVPCSVSSEAKGARWFRAEEVRALVRETPEKLFFMHLTALKKYLKM